MYVCKCQNRDVEINLSRKEYESLQIRDECLRDAIDMLTSVITNLTLSDTLYQAINDDIKEFDKEESPII